MPGKKLLVADDSLTIQKVIRLALSNEGYDIQAISDGADAIQQIATFRPDVVLVDVSLPTRTAFDIKREVNSMPDHQGIRFVLMSSAFEKIDDTQADEVGFDGRLTKPFDPAHLRQVLTEVLNAPKPPQAFPNAPAPSTPPEMPPLPADEPEISPALGNDFSLELPKDLPPSDFEATKSYTFSSDDELWSKQEETAPPPVPVSANDEIKQLTESTIRMSGLAEMPSLNTTELDWQVSEPSMKPSSSFSDLGGSSFQVAAPTVAAEAELANPSKPIALNDPAIEEIIRRQVQETLEKIAQQILPEVAERVIKSEIHRLLNEKL